MTYIQENNPFKKSPLRKDKKKDKRTETQKWFDKAIEEGKLPNPDTKEKLKEWKEAYFEEKFV